MRREKKLTVRKNSFLKETWREYNDIFLGFIPGYIKKKYFNRKLICAAILFVFVDIAIAVLVYNLLF